MLGWSHNFTNKMPAALYFPDLNERQMPACRLKRAPVLLYCFRHTGYQRQQLSKAETYLGNQLLYLIELLSLSESRVPPGRVSIM